MLSHKMHSHFSFSLSPSDVIFKWLPLLGCKFPCIFFLFRVISILFSLYVYMPGSG